MTIECVEGKKHFWYTTKMTGQTKYQECMNCKATRSERFVFECGHEIRKDDGGVCRVCKEKKKKVWSQSHIMRYKDD